MRAYTLHEALVYGRGVERQFLCPSHGDSRPSAYLNIAKGVWYCFTCGARGGLTGEDALVEPDYLVMREWLNDKLAEHRVYPEAWLSRWDAGDVHPYWLNRVGEDAARHFRLGFDHERNHLTYPLRAANGGVLGVVRRPLEPGDGPKYLYPKGVDVSRLLFNYSPEHRDAVVLVEGALDAIALWNVGVRAFAIYGAQLSKRQVELIERIDPTYVFTCYDLDKAGKKAAWWTEQVFKHRMVDHMRWPHAWGKDIDEIGVENRRNVVSALADHDVWCVDSPTCRSSQTPQSGTRSSMSTSRRGRLRIQRTSA